MSRTGIILLGFGGPDSIDAVGPFMCNLMGYEPSDELVSRVCMRYLSIGGSSPLFEIAAEIAAGLEKRLADAGHVVPVRVGMRYWDPYIADTLADLVDAGCDRIVAVSLSPFESQVASGAYREAIAEALASLGDIEIVEAPLISTLPEYAEFFALSIASSITDIEPNDGAIVIFTAHSLPVADLVENDPYIEGLMSVARDVASRLGMAEGAPHAGGAVLPGVDAFGSADKPRPWFMAFQSQGAKPGEWLGPDLDAVIDAAAASGVPALVAAPIGFMTDHLETLYDLDTVAAERAMDAGLEWARAVVPNDHEIVLDGLAREIAKLL